MRCLDKLKIVVSVNQKPAHYHFFTIAIVFQLVSVHERGVNCLASRTRICEAAHVKGGVFRGRADETCTLSGYSLSGYPCLAIKWTSSLRF